MIIMALPTTRLNLGLIRYGENLKGGEWMDGVYNVFLMMDKSKVWTDNRRTESLRVGRTKEME